jgi:YVTN family beta-propeller protein
MQSRRRLIVFALFAACTARDERAPASRPPESATARGTSGSGWLVYASNEDGRTLSVIDAATDSVVATIDVGMRPRGVKVSPDGRTVYVALSGSPKCPPAMPDAECAKKVADRSQDGVAVVDVATRTTTKVLPAGIDPETFDVSADGRTLFVSNEDAATLSLVDVASGRIKGTVKTGREPEGVTIAPDGRTVWVTGETDHDVTVVDVASGKSIAQIDTRGQRPRAVGFLPDGSKAYVTNEQSGTVAVIDPSSHTVRASIPLPANSKPMGIAVSRDGSRVYVSTGRGGTVVVIDPVRDSVMTTVHVGRRPWGIALSADGARLYTANGPGNDVSVVNTSTMSVVKRVPVGSVPWGVAEGPTP